MAKGPRAVFLKANPLCLRCLEEGKTVPATEIDHVKPHRGNMDRFWDYYNWMALCRSCHSRKTYLETIGGKGG